MAKTQDECAGAAALSLIEAVLTHLEEAKYINNDGRDAIFESAIEAHEMALSEDRVMEGPAHTSIIKLLKVLQARADGVRLVGRPASPLS